jgi:hypothetical protein
MSIVLFFIKLAIASSVLNILYRQAYNILFFYIGRPYLWMATVFSIGFLWFLLGAVLDWSFIFDCLGCIDCSSPQHPAKVTYFKRRNGPVVG